MDNSELTPAGERGVIRRMKRQDRRASLIEKAGHAAAKEMPAIVTAMMAMVEDADLDPGDRREAAKLVMKIATEARLEEQRQNAAGVHQHLHLNSNGVRADDGWSEKVKALVAKAEAVPMIVEGKETTVNGNGRG